MVDDRVPGSPRTLRKRRISDDETRQQMIEAGRDLVAASGLTVSLEHLSFELVIQEARVSRSAVYRLWPYKEDYFSDLLLELAGITHPATAAYDQGTVELAVRTAIENIELIDTAEGRHQLLIELCRLGAEQNFRSLHGSPDWQTYVALTATLVGLDDGRLQTGMQQALHSSETVFIGRMSSFYEQMAAILGFRVRDDVPEGFKTLATLGGAIVEGLALEAVIVPDIADRRFKAKPFGADEAREWTLPSIGYASVLMGIVEPNPTYTDEDAARAKGLLMDMREQLSKSTEVRVQCP